MIKEVSINSKDMKVNEKRDARRKGSSTVLNPLVTSSEKRVGSTHWTWIDGKHCQYLQEQLPHRKKSTPYNHR
jgi:hypothetical protein